MVQTCGSPLVLPPAQCVIQNILVNKCFGKRMIPTLLQNTRSPVCRKNAGSASFSNERASRRARIYRKYRYSISAMSAGSVATSEEGKAVSSGSEREGDKKLADEYSTTMQKAMGDAALVYRHELGMNFARVLPDLIVGSCLQSPEDAERLRSEESVSTVFCLQQDSDLDYFGLKLQPVIDKVEQLEGMYHIRHEIRDFDPFSLRVELPLAVAKLHRALRGSGSNGSFGKGSDPVAYVHCTAGLGRAPAVALAYMFWLRGFQLEEANETLQKVRRCSPKLQSIRAATCDLLSGGGMESVLLSWKNRGTSKSVEIAGLDVGWHNLVPLEHRVTENRWVLPRQLPIGTYLYKYVVDGNWTINPDAPLTPPDKTGNVNNVLEVVGNLSNTPAWAMRQRLMEDGAPLLDDERRAIVEKLDQLADSLPPL
eukprot:TRINITY_DN26343_c0_g1_i1.p1 TRINITY_DN26343_c0_g1~~TRINITY_DN26343_c0_g1_i1.p1  ORF type:complete len:425 (+),score=71.89 TRINITY_DN26343_c0_g1_i1:91-1365(+)